MFKKILLCTDGSEQALHAVQMTADLACRLNAQVTLVHVLDLMIVYGPFALTPEAAPSSEITIGYLEEAQKEMLRHAGQVLEQAGVSHRTLGELGQPVERIVTLAEHEQADLVVLGSRGLSRWKALLLGSVSEGVVHHAPCSVLIVREATTKWENILIASDGSEGAGRAVREGMELGKACQAAVTVCNVVERHLPYHDVLHEHPTLEAYAVKLREAVNRQVEPVAQELAISYQLCQEEGHPAEALGGYAERQKADLIVMGSRGLGGFQRLMLGSVCDSVLHHAPCSVLVVR